MVRVSTSYHFTFIYKWDSTSKISIFESVVLFVCTYTTYFIVQYLVVYLLDIVGQDIDIPANILNIYYVFSFIDPKTLDAGQYF